MQADNNNAEVMHQAPIQVENPIKDTVIRVQNSGEQPKLEVAKKESDVNKGAASLIGYSPELKKRRNKRFTKGFFQTHIHNVALSK